MLKSQLVVNKILSSGEFDMDALKPYTYLFSIIPMTLNLNPFPKGFFDISVSSPKLRSISGKRINGKHSITVNHHSTKIQDKLKR